MQNSKTDNISILIANGWKIYALNARYSNGVWIGISPQSADALIDLLDLDDSADIESAGLSEYLLNKGSWLPISFGSDLEDALTVLKLKISNLTSQDVIYGSDWSNAVLRAYQSVVSASDGGYGIAIAIDNNNLPSHC